MMKCVGETALGWRQDLVARGLAYPAQGLEFALHHCVNQAQWHRPVVFTLTLRRWRNEDWKLTGILSYMERLRRA